MRGKRDGALSSAMIDALIPHECPTGRGKACYRCIRKRQQEQEVNARETRRRYELDVLGYKNG